jgi:tetratricopeptide (TPR) repeat protein
MSKPMLVTLPFVLLLLDYWPLCRTGSGPSVAGGSAGAYGRLFREKLPLFAMTGMSCVASYYAGKIEGVLGPEEMYPLRFRIPNALVSYVRYLGKTVWPRYLAVHYPHPRDALPLWQAAVALLLLVGLSVLVFRLRRRYPYLSVGWAWYVGTLVPVIGIVQVGGHAMADRYTYVPLIGLFIIVAWGVPDLIARWRYRPAGLAVSAVVSISALTVCTWHQVAYWQDSVTLAEHAVRVTSNNLKMHYNLGLALLERGSIEAATYHFAKAVLINPDYANARCGLGVALLEQGKVDEAVEQFLEALRIEPDNVDAHYNLGNALIRQEKFEEAVAHYAEAIRINPNYADAHYNLGVALVEHGNFEEAVGHFSQVIRIDPENADAHNRLGTVLKQQGKLEEAIEQFSKALAIDPDHVHARGNLGGALLKLLFTFRRR